MLRAAWAGACRSGGRIRSTWPARIGAAAQSINGKASGADDCPPAGGELTTAAFVRSSVSPGPDHPHLDREGAQGQSQPDDEQPIGLARSDERRVGKGCVRTCKSSWVPVY